MNSSWNWAYRLRPIIRTASFLTSLSTSVCFLFEALDILHENKAVYPRKLGHQTSMSNSKGVLLGCYAVEVRETKDDHRSMVFNQHFASKDVLSNSRVYAEILKSTQKRITSFDDRTARGNGKISCWRSATSFCNEFLWKVERVRREMSKTLVSRKNFRVFPFSPADGRASDQIEQIFFAHQTGKKRRFALRKLDFDFRSIKKNFCLIRG